MYGVKYKICCLCLVACAPVQSWPSLLSTKLSWVSAPTDQLAPVEARLPDSRVCCPGCPRLRLISRAR